MMRDAMTPPASRSEVLIEVRGLRKYFPFRRSLFGRSREAIRAVDGVDFAVYRGDTFGLVGESGCGKTTASRLILGLEQPTSGSILFDARDISRLDREGRRAFRGKLQAVFQDPASSLSPRMRVWEIVGEPMIANDTAPQRAVRERVAEVLQEVGLPADAASRYPHEFSGGQRQRIAIARALVSGSQCIILDEPVSALDVSIRAQILNLLKKLQRQHGLTYILISHDLAAVRYLSTRIGVMYLGRLVEIATTEHLYAEPLHPYTQALLDSVLPIRPAAAGLDTPSLAGEVPSARTPPSGCRFHPRCPRAQVVCAEVEPELRVIDSTRLVACHFAEQTDARVTEDFSRSTTPKE
jgi:oligopeptide/dipeptide ABC transporter ATP-binding protein